MKTDFLYGLGLGLDYSKTWSLEAALNIQRFHLDSVLAIFKTQQSWS